MSQKDMEILANMTTAVRGMSEKEKERVVAFTEGAAMMAQMLKKEIKTEEEKA